MCVFESIPFTVSLTFGNYSSERYIALKDVIKTGLKGVTKLHSESFPYIW